MTPISKLLLRYIQDNANASKELKLSNKEIGVEIGVHASSVSKCVRLLKIENLIETKYDDNLDRTIILK